MRIGEFRKRKLTMRPLKEFERALGHRLHVEGWQRYDRMPPDVWNFHAYHYLDTADPALAAYAMLVQMSRTFEWIVALPGFNNAAAGNR